MAHATVSRCLTRRGMSRAPRPAREQVRRFEWPCPGDLLQMDTKRLARFSRPGHKVTGDRSTTSAEKSARVGWEFCHSIIDDHSRLVYTELHADERADTVTGFVERALGFFAGHGITARRLQTDNAWTYIHNRGLRELLDRARHPAPADPAAHPQAQRQGRALPADPGPRMGLRTALPLKHHPSRSAPDLARSTTTPPGPTARSATGRPSAASPFGRTRGRTASGGSVAPSAGDERPAQQRTPPTARTAGAANPAARSDPASEARVKNRRCWPCGSKCASKRSNPTSAACTRPWNGTVTRIRPPGRSTRRASWSRCAPSATCSSTSEHQTRSTEPCSSGIEPSGSSRRRSAPGATARARSSAASAISTPTASQPAPRSAATKRPAPQPRSSTRSPGSRLPQQQRAAALERPRLRVGGGVVPERLVVRAHRRAP